MRAGGWEKDPPERKENNDGLEMELVVIVASAIVLAVRFDSRWKDEEKEVSRCRSGLVAGAVGVRLKSRVKFPQDGVISVTPSE